MVTVWFERRLQSVPTTLCQWNSLNKFPLVNVANVLITSSRTIFESGEKVSWNRVQWVEMTCLERMLKVRLRNWNQFKHKILSVHSLDRCVWRTEIALGGERKLCPKKEENWKNDNWGVRWIKKFCAPTEQWNWGGPQVATIMICCGKGQKGSPGRD